MDTAFKSRPWPSYTSAELAGFVAAGSPRATDMQAEINRRAAVASGDLTRAFPAERLAAISKAEGK